MSWGFCPDFSGNFRVNSDGLKRDLVHDKLNLRSLHREIGQE